MRLLPSRTETLIRATRSFLIEIKPDHVEGLAEGRVQVGRHVDVMNKALLSGEPFVRGKNVQGIMFIHFGEGLRFWQLTWRTPEPGVTLYRWSRSRDKHDTLEEAIAANGWEEIPRQELKENERLVERVLHAAFNKEAFPAEFRGRLYLPTRCPSVEKPEKAFDVYWRAATAKGECPAD